MHSQHSLCFRKTLCSPESLQVLARYHYIFDYSWWLYDFNSQTNIGNAHAESRLCGELYFLLFCNKFATYRRMKSIIAIFLVATAMSIYLKVKVNGLTDFIF